VTPRGAVVQESRGLQQRNESAVHQALSRPWNRENRNREQAFCAQHGHNIGHNADNGSVR
jgi:hypothetical protein